MSVEFIKSKKGSTGIDLAIRQQDQISYFTQSQIQDEINLTYLEQWAERKYISNDYFLNWVKAIFKTDNFLSFFKYLRNPLPSARLVNDKLVTALERVFHSEDSYFKYNIRGEDIDIPEELNFDKFQKKIFNALLFNYNDILVHDLKNVNEPFREIVSIKNIVAIESYDSVIYRLAYTACIKYENGLEISGYLYMDDKEYVFYDKDYNSILAINHDLGVCPADYISSQPFKDNDVVRKSIFSYVKEEFEEYVFLKTLQRITEVNGAFPVVSMLDVKEKNKTGRDKDTAQGEPMSSKSISSQQAEYGSGVINSSKGNPHQAASVIKVPPVKNTDGTINMDVVKNFLNFFYIPVDILDYINGRIDSIETSIIVNVLGDYSEASEAQKNELQVAKSYENKQDKLRSLSMQMSRVLTHSDYKLLALKYGKDSVMVDCFFGSDFFLETQEDLYKLYALAPNPIERKNILVRSTQNRNKFNINKAEREKLLYNLMPYSNDKDFTTASARGLVDDITFLYQTRFTYWIDSFESLYGDIVYFYELIEGTVSEKITVINNLINNIIKEYYEQAKASGTLESVQE